MSIGDIIHVAGIPHEVIAESLIRGSVNETEDERKKRIKLGIRAPEYGYIAQTVRPVLPEKNT